MSAMLYNPAVGSNRELRRPLHSDLRDFLFVNDSSFWASFAGTAFGGVIPCHCLSRQRRSASPEVATPTREGERSFANEPTRDETNPEDSRDADEATLQSREETRQFLKMASIVAPLSGISSLAMPFLLKDQFLLGPAQVSFVGAVLGLPWIVKPVIAMYSDAHPIMGLRRKPYALAALGVQAFGSLSLAALSMVHPPFPVLMGVLLMNSTANAVSSTVLNAISTELTITLSAEQASDFISELSILGAVTSLPVSWISGQLTGLGSPAIAIALSSLAHAGLGYAVWKYKELPAPEHRITSGKWREDAEDLFLAMRQGGWVTAGPIVYSLIAAMLPDYGDAMFYFYTDNLKLTPSFLGTLGMFDGAFGLAGVLLYRKFVKNFKVADALKFGWGLSCLGTLSEIMLVTGYTPCAPVRFVFIRSLFTSLVSPVVSLPVAVTMMRLAPPGREASASAVFDSVGELSNSFNRVMSGGALMFAGISAKQLKQLPNMIMVCGVVNALSYPLYRLIPKEEEIDKYQAQMLDKLVNKDKRESIEDAKPPAVESSGSTTPINIKVIKAE